MSVLLLRLAAPLQSWGAASRHMTRGTLTMPTKSGVIGILAAALGRRRGDDLSQLASLRFGVRVDQPGRLLIDYHTVSGASHAPNDPAGQRLPTAAGGSLEPAQSTKVTRRHYLADAVFVAGVEGPEHLIVHLADALRHPRFALYLGRRSCPPAKPLLLGVVPDMPLESALEAVEWQAGPAERARQQSASQVELAVAIEDPAGDDTLPDQPVASPPFNRRFAERPLRHALVRMSLADTRFAQPAQVPAHDPMSLLET